MAQSLLFATPYFYFLFLSIHNTACKPLQNLVSSIFLYREFFSFFLAKSFLRKHNKEYNLILYNFINFLINNKTAHSESCYELSYYLLLGAFPCDSRKTPSTQSSPHQLQHLRHTTPLPALL